MDFQESLALVMKPTDNNQDLLQEYIYTYTIYAIFFFPTCLKETTPQKFSSFS